MPDDRKTDRFTLRPDPAGWTVLEIWTGQPAVVAGVPQSSLSEDDAKHMTDLLNTQGLKTLNTARAGIPGLKYNLTFLGVPRSAPTPGRGGASYSTFVYDQAKQDPPLTKAGPVSADAYWERVTYFLERVMPVATEHKVKMAFHPQDPAMPADRGFRGVHTVLGTVDGLKRFVTIAESPYHGLNFCQGTVSEMLHKPGVEIFDVIRYFGSRGKIFNVHFRNIRGGFLNFQETFIDDGDVDMLKAMRVYKEIGFDGMMMPDHVPSIASDARGAQAFAFTFGYIKALIAAVAAEA